MWSNPRLFHLGILLLLLLAFTPKAHADITVLLEEPYSYDGALAGTGHAAVYLNRVCAASPVVLRRCRLGEHGVVISRYNRIAGYDWIAIPLIPYLYAVEDPEDVPLYADHKLVAFLRDQYRRSHLEELAPDTPSGEAPKGDWVQLVGSSYDRTSYGFQIETSAAQDDALIAWFNSHPNRAAYRVLSSNCADFVREVVNFYYPHAVSRGFITDLEITTPKHAAKSLVKYSRRHPDLELKRLVFPQVPGTVKRSRPVRGVLESVFRAKKYVLPLAVFHPLVAGGVTSVYLLGDRFNPARDTLVFNVDGEPTLPVTKAERRTYSGNLKAMIAADSENGAERDGNTWKHFLQDADMKMDQSGQAILHAPFGNESVEMGINRDDLVRSNVPVDLQKGLVEARLGQELSSGRAPRTSGDQLREDWQLLQRINSTEQAETSKLLSDVPRQRRVPPATDSHGN